MAQLPHLAKVTSDERELSVQSYLLLAVTTDY
jgi:hypothetical protein